MTVTNERLRSLVPPVLSLVVVVGNTIDFGESKLFGCGCFYRRFIFCVLHAFFLLFSIRAKHSIG